MLKVLLGFACIMCIVLATSIIAEAQHSHEVICAAVLLAVAAAIINLYLLLP
jgi:hypothetical protein